MTTKQQKQRALNTEYTIAASIIALAALLGMAAWVSRGDTLLWALIESGLAWCL